MTKEQLLRLYDKIEYELGYTKDYERRDALVEQLAEILIEIKNIELDERTNPRP
jgi:hypothetical protein